MKLGEIEFHIVCVGHVRLDGGAMSGVIPRPLWEKKIPPDARNRITLAVNCLLIHAGDKRIPVETGGGPTNGMPNYAISTPSSNLAW
jgi:hypothetical protein